MSLATTIKLGSLRDGLIIHHGALDSYGLESGLCSVKIAKVLLVSIKLLSHNSLNYNLFLSRIL